MAEARRAIDIATQAFSLLNTSIEKDVYLYDDGTAMGDKESMMKLLARHNLRHMNMLRRMTPEIQEQVRREAEERRSKKKAGTRPA